MSKTFKVIVADPPWPFADKLKMSDVARGAEANYSVMSIKDIRELPIAKFSDSDGCILALWVPSSLLQEGLDTMKDWGFKHKQTYIWVKTKKFPMKGLFKSILKGVKQAKSLRSLLLALQYNINEVLAFGMGRLFRQTHEICLIGVNNSKIYKSLKNKAQRSVSFAPNLRHSAKPEDLQDSLDIMFPEGNRLELFARRHRSDWVCLGNEVCNGEDIRDSLNKL